ncbi:MAG: hypothetical protein ACLPV4_10725, partial [Solirubrobacteraceae bacterium]
RRELSEGHGRALLLATEHADRRRLASAAVEGGWSVRELEERARRANDGTAARPQARLRRPALHPDQEAAIAQITDSFGAALGLAVDVSVTAAGDYRVHLTFESVDDALELASRVALNGTHGPAPNPHKD